MKLRSLIALTLCLMATSQSFAAKRKPTTSSGGSSTCQYMSIGYDFGLHQHDMEYSMQMNASGNYKISAPGSELRYTFSFKNFNQSPCAPSNFQLNTVAVPAGWSVRFESPTSIDGATITSATANSIQGSVPNYSSVNVTMVVTSPLNALAGTSYELQVSYLDNFMTQLGYSAQTLGYRGSAASDIGRGAQYEVIGTTPAPCVRKNPTIVFSPDTLTGSRGQTLTYTATVTNQDSADCPAQEFKAQPMIANPTGWNYSGSAPFTLSPGQSQQVSFTITSPTDTFYGGSGTHWIQGQVQSTSNSKVYGIQWFYYNIP